VAVLAALYAKLRLGGEARAGRHAQAMVELVKRLWLYPIILFVTQLPIFWDDFAYFKKVFSNDKSVVDGSGTTRFAANARFSDDAFYKDPTYEACWFLYYLLVPLAGFFFAVYFTFVVPSSRDRIRRLFGLVSIKNHSKVWLSQFKTSTKASSRCESTSTAIETEVDNAAELQPDGEIVSVSQLDDEKLVELLVDEIPGTNVTSSRRASDFTWGDIPLRRASYFSEAQSASALEAERRITAAVASSTNPIHSPPPQPLPSQSNN